MKISSCHQVIHSKKFMRAGTIVGSFKIDLKTVYDAIGTITNYSLIPSVDCET